MRDDRRSAQRVVIPAVVLSISPGVVGQNVVCYEGNMTTIFSFNDCSDRDLLAEVSRLAGNERAATARLVASLAEVDARRLYLSEGYSSLFTYCTLALHLSEHAAYNRIEAARAARRFPQILELLADGSIHLTAVRLLAPTLTPENHRALLDAARHKSKRDVECLVVQLKPEPDVVPCIRKLPAPAASALVTEVPPVIQNPKEEVSATSMGQFASPAAVPRPVIRPLSPERYKVQFTVSKETHDKLRRAQDLIRHTVPNGDPAAIFDRALTLLLSELERTKLAAAKRPRTTAAASTVLRHIPAAVKRAVWSRDGGRCAFLGNNGRCTETGFLEFHHIKPYADGGEASIANLELRCRPHNAYEAEQYSAQTVCYSGANGLTTIAGGKPVPERGVSRDRGSKWC
jgi:hypothetical protein